MVTQGLRRSTAGGVGLVNPCVFGAIGFDTTMTERFHLSALVTAMRHLSKRAGSNRRLSDWPRISEFSARRRAFRDVLFGGIGRVFHPEMKNHLRSIRRRRGGAIVVGRTIKDMVVLQGWRDVAQDKGRNGCCVVTASAVSFCVFTVILRKNSRSEQAMLKRATRQLMFWFVYWRSGDLASR